MNPVISHKAGIVGAGTVFEEHMDAYLALGVKVKTVADIDSEKLSKVSSKYGVATTKNWKELIGDSSIGIVSICTPAKFHKEMVIAALMAGKHVICEKPLALNLVEADEILKVEKEAKGKLTVAHQFRYSSDSQKLKLVCQSKAAGPISLARCIRYDPPPSHLLQQGVWGSWELSGGGVLMTKGIHQIDMLLWLLGKVKRVQAIMGTYFYQIQSEDQIIANLEFENGALATLCISGHPFTGHKETLDLIGKQGMVSLPWNLKLTDEKKQVELEEKIESLYPSRLSQTGRGVKKIIKKIRNRILVPKNDQTAVLSPRNAFSKAFIDGLSSSEIKVPVSAAEGRAAMEVCTALYMAALNHSTVELPLKPDSPFYKGISKEDYDARLS